MKSITNYLNSMKSMYFMLLAYIPLLMGVTSCRQDEFANYEPEKQQKYSKTELIEQALSRIPQTRAENSNAVIMVTIQDTIAFQCHTTETMKVFVDGEEHPAPITEINKDCNHIFTNGFPSHSITIVGSKEAIRELDIDNNGLIMLNVSGNTNLIDLFCQNNHLDAIGLTGCKELTTLDISNNEFSFINIEGLPVAMLYAENNQLTALDISKNLEMSTLRLGNNFLKELYIPDHKYLFTLEIENNQLTSLDLSNCPDLMTLNASFNPITDLNLGKSESLMYVYLEHLPLKTINNHPLDDTSFAIYPMLWDLNVAYTPFESLDLSHNLMLMELNISRSEITQLNISNLVMYSFNATHSKLTNLIGMDSGLKGLHELRIERTPFEEDSLNMSSLPLALPSRTEISPGHLYTYSPWINYFASDFERINWVINR